MAKKSSKVQILEYLESHPNEQYTVDELANILGFANSTISKNALLLAREDKIYGLFIPNPLQEVLLRAYRFRSEDGRVGIQSMDETWASYTPIIQQLFTSNPSKHFTTSDLEVALHKYNIKDWMARSIAKALAEKNIIYGELRHVFRYERSSYQSIATGLNPIPSHETHEHDYSYYVFCLQGNLSKTGLHHVTKIQNEDDEHETMFVGDTIAIPVYDSSLNDNSDYGYEDFDSESNHIMLMVIFGFLLVLGLMLLF